jgi:hypothetical protein
MQSSMVWSGLVRSRVDAKTAILLVHGTGQRLVRHYLPGSVQERLVIHKRISTILYP